MKANLRSKFAVPPVPLGRSLFLMIIFIIISNELITEDPRNIEK